MDLFVDMDFWGLLVFFSFFVMVFLLFNIFDDFDDDDDDLSLMIFYDFELFL